MNPERLQARLALLAETLERLRAIPQGSLDEFCSDDRNVDAALHRLQVAIQILIDVGSHVVSRLGLGAPRTSRDVLVKLEDAGHLPDGSTERFGKMFGFRNRVVHLYDRVDERFVFEIITQHLDDLSELGRRYVDALDGDE